MLRSIWIAVGAAVLLAVGALTAAAANSHGKTVSTLATGTTLKGEAKGDAISTLASTKSDAANVAARAAADADEANDEAEDGDNDAHGDAVSSVARSDATAAHENGKKKVNHGGAVSVAAHNHD